MAVQFALVTIARPGKPPRTWLVPEDDQFLAETEEDLESWYPRERGGG